MSPEPTISRSFPPAATAALPDIMQAFPKVTLSAVVPTETLLGVVENARTTRGIEPGWAARLQVDVRDLPKVIPTTTVHVTVVQTVPFELTETDRILALHRFAMALHPGPKVRFDALAVLSYGQNRAVDENFGWQAASIASAAGLPTNMTVDESAKYKIVVYTDFPQELGYWVEPRDFRSLRGFAFGLAKLTPDHEARLTMLAREIVQSWHSASRVSRVVIQGHTDPVGKPKFNEDLGRRRAQAVAGRLRRLVNRFGGSLPAGTVDRVPFVVETYGETRPISRRWHALNRRVEVALYRDRSAPPVPVDMEPLVVQLEGIIATSTLPADTKKRLTCMLGKVRDPASDDRFVNDMQVFLIKRDRAMPRPTEWSRVRNLVLNPALFGRGKTDAQLLENLQRIDGEIIEGVMRMNQIIAYASGGEYATGLLALPTAFKEFNAWVLERLKDPTSVYSCHPELRP